MYKSYEIDYHGRSYLLGNSKTLQEAKNKERKALKASKGEFPTFTEDGEKCVTHNGKNLLKAMKTMSLLFIICIRSHYKKRSNNWKQFYFKEDFCKWQTRKVIIT